jgi:hypothetical protein
MEGLLIILIIFIWALSARRSTIKAAQFILCFFEYFLPFLWKVSAGAIDIEGQHRHGRAKWFCFAPRAFLRGLAQRTRDLCGIVECEHVRFKAQRIARFSDMLRPALLFGRSHGSTPILSARLEAFAAANKRLSAQCPSRDYVRWRPRNYAGRAERRHSRGILDLWTDKSRRKR